MGEFVSQCCKWKYLRNVCKKSMRKNKIKLHNTMLNLTKLKNKVYCLNSLCFLSCSHPVSPALSRSFLLSHAISSCLLLSPALSRSIPLYPAQSRSLPFTRPGSNWDNNGLIRLAIFYVWGVKASPLTSHDVSTWVVTIKMHKQKYFLTSK